MGKPWDLKRMLFNLSALVDLGQEVTSAKAYAERMRTAVYVITGMFSVPRAALFVHDPDQRCLDYVTGKGIVEMQGVRLSLRSSDVRQLPRNEPFLIHDMRAVPFFQRYAEVLAQLDARVAVSLFAKDEFIGILTLGRRLSRKTYLRSEWDVLKVAAHQLASAVHNARLFTQHAEKARENKRLYEDMRRIYQETIEAFAAAIDAKDEYTKHHSYRVAHYASAIARQMGWRREQVEAIYIAGLLHDIGKITIDRGVINKSSDLTIQEREEIRSHPQISYEILSKIRFPWKEVVHFIRHHHERPDGKGYPDALGEQDLSDGVKILALSDAFDAMTSDRPYRQRLPLAEAVREIERCAGTQFDLRISAFFIKMLEREIKGKSHGQPILENLNVDIRSFNNANGPRYTA
jgi:putative nucleotidyltransferase with HDIG domain